MAFQHVGQLEHRAAKFLKDVAGLVRQADLDEYQQACLEVLRIQPCRITHDDALAFQPAYAFGAWGGRESDALAQFGEGQTPFGLQDAQDLAIDLVQFSAALMASSHGEIPSTKSAFGVKKGQR